MSLRNPVSGVRPHFDRGVFRATVQSHLQERLSFSVPDTIERYVEFSEEGIPRMSGTPTSEMYLDVLEDLMSYLSAWAGHLADLSEEFDEVVGLHVQRKEYLEREAYLNAEGSIKDRELRAKHSPDVRAADYEVRVYKAMHNRLEQGGRRLDKQVDVLKYSHRRLMRRESTSGTVPD